MDRALVKGTMGKLPPGLAALFDDPPVVGVEKREDYNNLFSAIVAAINPGDAIAWLLARDLSGNPARKKPQVADHYVFAIGRGQPHPRTTESISCCVALSGSRGREAGQGSETMGR